MKPPLLLKTILDICYILLIVSFGASTIFFIYLLFSSENYVPLEYNGYQIHELTRGVISLLFSEILVSALFIYLIHLIRNLIRSFFDGKLFTRLQISLFRLTGQFIILTTILQAVISLIADIYLKGEVHITPGLDNSFGSFWLILALGLFFIYLSKVFHKAKSLKEENELTV